VKLNRHKRFSIRNLISFNPQLSHYSNDEEGKILLHKLARINRPLQIAFKDMLKLMQQCNEVDKQRDLSKRKATRFAALYDRNAELNAGEVDENIQGDAPVAPLDEEENNRGIFTGANPFSLFSGVFPGTVSFQ